MSAPTPSSLCHSLLPLPPPLPLPLFLPIHFPSLSVKFLLESVKTFTEEDTASGLDQARQLIVEVLMDSQCFVFDHMLRLPAVRALNREPLHKVRCLGTVP